MTTEAIAEVRPVFVDAWGQQVVHDDDGNQVFGVWIKPMGESEDAPAPDLVLIGGGQHF